MIKSPIFYSILFVAVFASIGFVLLFGVEADSPLTSIKNSIFDSSQYLFPNQARTSITNTELSIVEGSVLPSLAPPFLVSSKTLGAAVGTEESNKDIKEYGVEAGDTMTSVAEKFGISVNTIAWANGLTSSSNLKEGQKLVILPVSGIMHMVGYGDTVGGVALLYKASQEDIVEFNELGDEGKIFAGDFLIIPGATKPKAIASYTQVPLSQSYFICPIPAPCRVTQGLHWYNAIDFSNGVCGEPVFAAAAGTVQRTGFTTEGGNYVRIVHPNDVVTYYGHLSSIAVSAGNSVYQGQIIGYVGHTGATIPSGEAGCHVHFDVRFASNPFARYMAGDLVAGSQ